MRHRIDYAASFNAYQSYLFHATACTICLLGLVRCEEGDRLFGLFRSAEEQRNARRKNR